jgi:signal transduction histidine kinase
MVASAPDSRATGRWWQWLSILACAAIALATAGLLDLLGFRWDQILIQIVLYGAGYLIAGSIAWLRRPDNPIGPIMLATSAAISLSFFTLHPEPLVWRLAGLSGSIANILVVWIMLAAPSGRLASGLGRSALGAFAVVVLLGAVLEDLDTRRAVWAVGMVVSLALAVIVVRRWVTASAPSRRSLAPVVVAGVTAALVHALDFSAGVLLIAVTPGSPIQLADAISRALVPYGFLLGLLRLRMARGAVADLVVELSDTPPPERLRDALAGALGDPTLEVIYWSEDFRTYLDGGEEPVDIGADTSGRAVTLLERGGRPLAAILHDPALAEDPGLVAAVGAAVRLAVDNERLTAEVRSQLAEVQASRTRIVEASDAERRRVERNLHDGAQQRLVALSLALRRAKSQLPADAGPELTSTLDAAADQLKAALAELRELAKGIHPAILTEAGLGPALRSLARESPTPVTARLDVPDDVPGPVAAAAYYVAAEALTNIAKYANAGQVELIAGTGPDGLRIEIADDGGGGADPAAGSGLRGLADRVAALGGRLEILSPAGGGTRIVATIPLADDASGTRSPGNPGQGQ